MPAHDEFLRVDSYSLFGSVTVREFQPKLAHFFLSGIRRDRLKVQAEVLRVLADDRGGKELRNVLKILGLKLLRKLFAVRDQRPKITRQPLIRIQRFLQI